MLPESVRDPAVKLADAVGLVRHADGESREVEPGIVIAVDAAQAEQALPVHPAFTAPGFEILGDQLGCERHVASGHRGVGREQRVSGGAPDGLVEGDLVLLDPLPDPFQRQQRGVSLVHVPHRRLHLQRPQCQESSDAQNVLLTQPHLPSLNVEDRGDRAVVRTVLRDVGVEQQNRNAPDLRLPALQVELSPRHRHAHQQRLAVRAGHRADRQAPEIEIRVEVLMQPLRIDGLLEIPAAIHQADAEEGESEIAGRLAVVAGQDTEAAGVDPDAAVPAVLGGEIGDRATGIVRIRPREPARVDLGHVPFELVHDVVVPGQKALVEQELLPALRLEIEEHLDRVAIA